MSGVRTSVRSQGSARDLKGVQLDDWTTTDGGAGMSVRVMVTDLPSGLPATRYDLDGDVVIGLAPWTTREDRAELLDELLTPWERAEALAG